MKPGDSIYIEPNVKFGFYKDFEIGYIYLVTSESGIDLNTQKEISSINNPDRIIFDDEQWFEGK